MEVRRIVPLKSTSDNNVDNPFNIVDRAYISQKVLCLIEVEVRRIVPLKSTSDNNVDNPFKYVDRASKVKVCCYELEGGKGGRMMFNRLKRENR